MSANEESPAPRGNEGRATATTTVDENHSQSSRPTPFADGADAVLASGLGSPLPVPFGKKKAPPSDYTGANGIRPSGADLAEWKTYRGGDSIAIRLAPDVVFIDVDDYDDKEGAATVAAFEAEHGTLAPTWRLTSRDDDVNGHRMYRLPEGVDEADLADMGRGVEVIRAGFRYAIAGGSVHPNGGVYEYVAPDGTRSLTPPHEDDLPVLTTEHVEGLRRKGKDAPAREAVSTTELVAQLGAHPDLVQGLRGYLVPAGEAFLADVARHAAMREGDRLPNGDSWGNTEKGAGLVGDDLCRAFQFDATAAALGEPEVYVERTYALYAASPWPTYATDRGDRDAKEAARRGPALPADWDAKVAAAQRSGTPAPSTSLATAGTSLGADDGDTVLPDRYKWTDVAVAEDFGRHYAGRLMHSDALGWLFYTKGRWKAIPDKIATDFVRSHAKRLARRAVGDGSDEMKAAAKRLEGRALAAAAKIAQGLPGISVDVEELDADPYLLNCANGTLDLRTMRLRPHDPADKLTKITAAAYRPDTDRRVWEAFLTSSLPDAEERAYLQRVVGQALVGRVVEHLFPVLTGLGGNGKGTFYGIVNKACGDYSVAIDPTLLMSAERGKPGGPEMMRLLGARLVFASETDEGRKLDQALMKRLTGGDPLEARHLFKAPVEWEPTHQLIYITNHLPQVKANDPAVWRRMRIVPFDVVIPDEQKDVNLPETLELHLEAVLAWAVEGYSDYTDGGMREPATVLAATAAYQRKSDDVARFIAEECLVSPAASVRARALFEVWERWARRNEADPRGEVWLANELERLGYEKGRTAAGVVRKGLSPHVYLEGAG